VSGDFQILVGNHIERLSFFVYFRDCLTYIPTPLFHLDIFDRHSHVNTRRGGGVDADRMLTSLCSGVNIKIWLGHLSGQQRISQISSKEVE